MKQIISKEKLEMYQNSFFRVITVTPDDKEPYIEEWPINKLGLDEFLEHYSEFSAFIISIELLKMQ